MVEENKSQEFRLKNIDESRYYFLKNVKQNELVSKNNKQVSLTLNYIGHFLMLASATTGCVSISSTSLIGILIGITSPKTVGIGKYKPIIKKKKKSMKK